MGDTKAYSNNKTLCVYVNAKGIKCKGIALRKSLYCQHHIKHDTTLQEVTLNQTNQSARYTHASESVRARINTNLSSPSLLDLRHEIALLQAWLQELLDAPVSRFDKQLQVIDRIERLVTNFQRVKLSAQALAQAENKVKLVINNVVLIIKGVVTDKEQRLEIARRLSELGQQYESEQQSATLLSGAFTQAPINNESALSINNNAAVVPSASIEAAPRGASQTGDPGVGIATGQDIPSPCSSLPPCDNPSALGGGV